MSRDRSTVLIGDLMQQSGVPFGTSGARGLVTAMTDEVCFAYTLGFLQYLASIGDFHGTAVAVAGDLRPSSPRILAACIAAIRALGAEPIHCGFVPSPAVALHGFGRGIPSLMVTGSHIPDDRNGIKFNRSQGEVLKTDEAGIRSQRVTLPAGRFDAAGALLNPEPLPAVVDVGTPYVKRYVDFFGPDALRGLKIGVYQHSAVGRDLLVDVVAALGGTALPLGRSATFIPVDTEAVRPEDSVLARTWAAGHGFDALVSTDGDSDRPLIADETGAWLRGDVLGVLCARSLGARCAATPVSSNTALEKSGWFADTLRTRIGSPFVVAAMQTALERGLDPVVGYEANGGFLLGSPVVRDGRTLPALPTRDAFLPMLAVLVEAKARGIPLSGLLATLPPRYTHSDRLQDFPVERSAAKLAALQPDPSAALPWKAFEDAFGSLSGTVTALDTTDGLRASFANDEIIHLRPSGNAPELRCYTEAATPQRAIALNADALAVLATWR